MLDEIARRACGHGEGLQGVSRATRKAPWQRSHALDYALTQGADKTQGIGNAGSYDLYAAASNQHPAPRRVAAAGPLPCRFPQGQGFSAQHADKTRRAVAKLMAWMEAKATQPTIGNVTREVAGDFLESVPGSRKTRVNVSGLLSSYFRYLVSPRASWTRIPSTAWPVALKSRSMPPLRNVPTPMKSFPPCCREATPPMLDTIRVLALSGMRASELCSLTVADCRGGLFRVHGGPDDKEGRRGKSAAAKRVTQFNACVIATVATWRG